MLITCELPLVLLLFAGTYKAAPWLSGFPVDITALAFALSVASGLGAVACRGFRVPARGLTMVWLMAPFVAYQLVSLLWSPGGSYAIRKAAFTATLAFWPYIAACLIVSHGLRRIKRLYWFMALFCVWLALESIRARYSGNPYGAVQVLGGNYLGVGRTIGVGAVLALVGVLHSSRWSFRLVCSSLTGLFAWVLVVMGGRGPLVGVVAAALVPLLVGIVIKLDGRLFVRRYALIMAAVGVSGVLGAAVALLSMERLPWTIVRMMSFGRSNDFSTMVRLRLFVSAIEAWMARPVFGHGIGSFDVVGHGLHAHNLILELLSELGAVGLALYALPWVYLFRRVSIRRVATDPLAMAAVMLLVNTLANAMVSGDLSSNRLLWLSMGLMVFSFRDTFPS